MYWIEDDDQERAKVPDDVIDVAFDIRCRALPVDHAWALSEAIHAALPWFAEEPLAGMHLFHGADSGNGWYRPDEADDLVYLSKRTKLVLRLPKARLPEAERLSGQKLEVAGNTIEVGKATVRLLSELTSLYARHVVSDAEQSEDEFLEQMVAQLRQMGVSFKKVLCGKINRFKLPDGELITRSLLVADLRIDDAIKLQEQGLGSHRKLGCGLFIPHKKV